MDVITALYGSIITGISTIAAGNMIGGMSPGGFGDPAGGESSEYTTAPADGIDMSIMTIPATDAIMSMWKAGGSIAERSGLNGDSHTTIWHGISSGEGDWKDHHYTGRQRFIPPHTEARRVPLPEAEVLYTERHQNPHLWNTGRRQVKPIHPRGRNHPHLRGLNILIDERKVFRKSHRGKVLHPEAVHITGRVLRGVKVIIVRAEVVAGVFQRVLVLAENSIQVWAGFPENPPTLKNYCKR